MKFKSLFLFLFFTLIVFGQEESQTLLSLKQTGVEEFLKTYPEFDGRGTIVLILDSGVDMGIDGLKKTSTGETKVIDVQDFSRQGDISFYEADIDEEDGVTYFVNEDKGFKVAGADKLKLKPVDDEYFIGLLDEKLFLNAGHRKPDLNENGKDDKFFFVTFKTHENGNEYWVVYTDLNANGDLSDEKPYRNFKDQKEPFFVEREKGVPYLTFGLNIFPEEKRVSFFFDDNGHGTHCAGIATGYKIGESDLNGVAPGANIIGLKIGNNEYSGGATVTESMKRAYEYADKLSRELQQPCVINMSYGIGSEIENHADMEIYLDELVMKNPYLYICKSAGNDGPGVSTLGQPSASRMCIVSGASLTKEIAASLYGAIHDEDVIYAFSGRGGEVDKPDIVSPGGCVSTMPNHASWDAIQGTSMASPYTAGVVALLMSGVKAKYPDVKVPSPFLQKVLRESAVPMKGYVHLDQGGGEINVMNAWNLLEKYIKADEISKFETYTITAFAPNMPDNSAPALYIRNGSYLTGKESFRYSIKRDNFIDKDKFYRIFDLKSDCDWLIPAQKSNHLRNTQGAFVDVEFDVSKMTVPGLYNGKVTAYRQGTNIPEFELMATVIMPYEFTSADKYSKTWKDLQLKPTRLNRYFVNVPAGASSMKIDLSVEENEYGMVYYDLFDPDGREHKLSATLTSYKEADSINDVIYDIYPGTWEVDVINKRTSSNISEYNLAISFEGVNILNGNTVSLMHNSLKVVNLYNSAKKYDLSGSVDGYEIQDTYKIKGFEEKEITFSFNKGESKKTFEIFLSQEDFNKNTDFAFLIYDESGKRIKSGGLGYQTGDISLDYKDEFEGKKFILKLVPGFVYETSEALVHVTEKVYFAKPVSVIVKNDKSSSVVLYPNLSEILTFEYGKPEVIIPEGAVCFGNLLFRSSRSGEIENEFSLKYKY